ncbi:MAG: prepilin-type N-terminal cleavage/methylation domain-containing protein [Candidatus Omnitrophota bacterium]
MANLHSRKQWRNGFTLIEIVVTIIIIGALAALSIPNLARFRESSITTEAIQAQSVIQNELEYLVIKNGNLCTGSGLYLPGEPYHSLIYNMLDTLPKNKFFIVGTECEDNNTGKCVVCYNSTLWIGQARDVRVAYTGTDPCKTLNNPKYLMSGCGGQPGYVDRSGIMMCRTGSGYYEFQGLGTYFGLRNH